MSKHLIPNSTQIPDVILDHWMAKLTGGEFKVLLYIARRTYGFGKESDSISLSQIAEGIVRRDGTVLDRGTGISRVSVTRSLKTLEDQGIIIRTKNYSESGREFEENTYSINLAWQPEDSKGPEGDESPPSSSGSNSKSGGVVTKCNHLVSKNDQGWLQNVTRVDTKVNTQETDQETDQETASSEGNESKVLTASDADAGFLLLVKELISHGVGRSTAENLVRTKPEACRRYLDYLPYAQVKTTKGDWLANAIRHEYGPPAAYVKAIEARNQACDSPSPEKKPSKCPAFDLQRKKMDRLRASYALLEKNQPEAFMAFQAFAVAERAKADQFSKVLSNERRAEVLSQFDREDLRLDLFGRWLETVKHGQFDLITTPPFETQAPLSN